MNKKAISSYRESRFRKFNSKYIENIKIARSISRAAVQTFHTGREILSLRPQ